MCEARTVLKFMSAAALAAMIGCAEPSATGIAPNDAATMRRVSSSTLAVTSTSPSQAPQDTTLDLVVNGSGFETGSTVSLQANGLIDQRVRVNSTRYTNSTQLVANVTIAADAVPQSYDAVVTNASGTKGIGTEMFTVVIRVELLPGATGVAAVNISGDMVGGVPGSTSCPVAALPSLWRSSGAHVVLPLTSAQGNTFCGAGPHSINSSGVIMGFLTGGAANQSGIWTPAGDAYVLQEVPAAPDGYQPIVGLKINDNGEFVGWHQRGAQVYWYSPTSGWLLMTMPAGATDCEAHRAINNSGAIVAPCAINGGLRNGYYWSDHTAIPVQLPRPAGETGEVIPRDINNSGVIVGYGATRAIEWTPDGAGGFVASYLPDLGRGAVAYAVAEDGSAVGHIIKSGNPSPSLWRDGAFQILELPSGVSSAEASSVTVLSAGGLVATGPSSKQGAYYWTTSNP